MSGSALDELAIGRDAIAACIGTSRRSRARLTFKWRLQQVRHEGDVASVNATGEIFAEPLAEPAYAMPYRITVVMIRRDGIWLRLGGVWLRAVHRVRADRRVDHAALGAARLGNV